MAQISRTVVWHGMGIGLSLQMRWEAMVCKPLVGPALDATCHQEAIHKHPSWTRLALGKLRLDVDTGFAGREAFQEFPLGMVAV